MQERHPVKNTFIHYGNEADNSQPFFERRSCSERQPVARGLWDEEQPAFLPQPSGSISEAPEPEGHAEEPCSNEPAFLAVHDSATHSAQDPSLTEPVMTIKNTFIHWDESDEQPSIFGRKSVSTPTYPSYFQQVGAGLALAATLTAAEAEAPAGVAPLTAATAAGEMQVGASAAVASAITASPGACNYIPRSMPSVGAAGHDVGKCRPCAHNWRPNGCSKGYDCTFCHMCEDGALKQRKKEKRERIKADQRSRKDSTEPSRNPEIEEEEEEQSTAEAVAEAPLTYIKGGHAEVSFSLDLRRFPHGSTRRFSLNAGAAGATGEAPPVPFLISVLQTRGGGGYDASSHSISLMVQVKCTGKAALRQYRGPGAQPPLYRVAFSVGGMAAREAASSHDFAAEALCQLPPERSSWHVDGSPPKGHVGGRAGAAREPRLCHVVVTLEERARS